MIVLNNLAASRLSIKTKSPTTTHRSDIFRSKLRGNNFQGLKRRLLLIILLVLNTCLPATAAVINNGSDALKAIENRLVYIEAWNIKSHEPCPTTLESLPKSETMIPGSGILIDNKRILTANHITKPKFGEKKCFLIFRKTSSKPLIANFVDSTPEKNIQLADRDIAILELTLPTNDVNECLSVGDRLLNNSEDVFFVGFEGQNSSVLRGAGMPEPLTGKRSLQRSCDALKPCVFDGNIADGHSGGPVLDTSGALVGVMFKANQGDGNARFEALWPWQHTILTKSNCNKQNDPKIKVEVINDMFAEGVPALNIRLFNIPAGRMPYRVLIEILNHDVRPLGGAPAINRNLIKVGLKLSSNNIVQGKTSFIVDGDQSIKYDYARLYLPVYLEIPRHQASITAAIRFQDFYDREITFPVEGREFILELKNDGSATPRDLDLNWAPLE